MNIEELEKLLEIQERNLYGSLPCMICGSVYTYVMVGDGLEHCDSCGFTDEMDYDHPLAVEQRLI